jgi:methionine-gamma-lyase
VITRESGFATRLVHSGIPKDEHGSVVPAIYQTSTFAFDSAEQGARRFAGDSDGYIYTRIGNPTVRAFEDCIAALEGAAGAVATSSGMAAVTTAYLALLRSGDHVVSTASVYGPSRVLLERHLSRYGIASSYVDTSDLAAVSASLRPETRMVYVETPSNPMMQVTDLRAVAGLAHANRAVLVVDSTFASPYLQRPLELGADVVLHSVTKFINGHADVVGGVIAARDARVQAGLRQTMTLTGCCMDPHQAFLAHRGLKTLALRVERAQASAAEIARWLEDRPEVAWVRYLGLASHPQHELARRQMSGSGTMISFELRGGIEAGRRLMNRVRLATLAVSLGGVETLIEHPASMTHSGVSAAERLAAGITDGLVRYSVGIEDVRDLLVDLEQAFAGDEHIHDRTPTEEQMMKVAVTCDDEQTVACHLGRAPLFMIYEVTDGKPVLAERRLNQHAGHSQPCSSSPNEAHLHHDHADVLAAVADCAMVVTRGMGRRIAADLEARGIKPALLARDVPPLEAAALAVAGQCLMTGGCCGCDHA